jgi:hypothetical protein
VDNNIAMRAGAEDGWDGLFGAAGEHFNLDYTELRVGLAKKKYLTTTSLGNGIAHLVEAI